MERSDALREGVAVAARGLLIVLAAPSVAALALDPGAPVAAALRVLAEIATIPAFYAVAGWLMAASIAAARPFGLLRILAPMAGCAAIAAACAAVTAPLAGLDWRAGVMQAAPIWSLALWPAVYALIVRIAPASPGAMFALALAAHVAGVILDKPILAHFIFFVAGLALALRREELFRLAREEPEFSIASGPFVVVLSTAIAIRFAATGQPASIAAVGPISLIMGLAIGPTALASAAALCKGPAGEALLRLGRAGPAFVMFWVPLFVTMIRAANRGASTSTASALLMALASLLIIAVIADIAIDARERAAFPGLTARR
ncbi:MAG: hypothetical protein KDJ20_04100 [Hyphomicrobiales bacterium]|nr:hypothetical protein [Hyphomicrobiales bacterium]